MPGPLVIYSICDESGNWPHFYERAGYDVRLIDIKRGQDARLLMKPKDAVHGVLCAPPCTVFASSGARWPRSERDYIEALGVVDSCLRFVIATKPRWWSLENPIGKLVRWLGKPKMYFQPCDYGDDYTKRTALWGEFNAPALNPVEPVQGSKMWRDYGGKSERTKQMRSATPLGFAKAFFEANP